MPRGSKKAYTTKQKRKAEHIEEGYEKRGVKKGEAEERAWRTVNKMDGGGKKSGAASKAKATRSTKKASAPKKKSGAKKTASRKSSTTAKKKSAGSRSKSKR